MKLQPAPLKFPNGGALKLAGNRKMDIQQIKRQIIDLNAKLAHAELDKKSATTPRPAAKKPAVRTKTTKRV